MGSSWYGRPVKAARALSRAARGSILSFALLASPAAAQWVTQSPVPTYLDVQGVAGPTTSRVFVTTADDSFDDGGALWESTDGGATWVQRDVPFSLFDGLHGIHFIDTLNGWVWGNENYRTTDGGTTWQELPFLGSTYYMRFDIPGFGLATGNFGRQVSRDGGLSWVESPNDIFRVDFREDQVGLGVSETGIYRTADGGDTFAEVMAGGGQAVTFLSNAVAVAIVDSTFARSTDGGLTWTIGADAQGKRTLFAVSADVVLATGRAGQWPDYDDRILRSADGGQTWSDLGEVMPQGVHSLAIPSGQVVVGADLAGNMYRSADAGQTWSQSFASPGPIPSFFQITEPDFPDAQTGYFGYGAGFVIKTTDGGQSWFQISSGTGYDLRDMGRFPSGEMIAVGEGGTVLRSDGASPWRMDAEFTDETLVAVHVIGPQEAAVVAESGQVYQSVDGGSSWTPLPTVPGELDEATDLYFTTLLDGWLVGAGFEESAIYHTTDGGVTWTPVPGVGGLYQSIDFEGDYGWAANASDIFYRTTDGGDTWEPGTVPASSGLINDMDFVDQSSGYAVGWFGLAVRSSDGGLTWEELPIPGDPDFQFTDIYVVGPNEVWLTTTEDFAYYTANAGHTWAALEIGSNGFGIFSSIIADEDGSAWAAGYQGYIEHFEGPPPPPNNRPPEASFEFTSPGMTVQFTDTSTDPDGVVVSWEWDFGDSTLSTEQNPVHTYDEEDTYIVYLTVTDDDGDQATTGRAVVAQEGPGGVFGDFTEVTPFDPLFVTPQDEDFWVATTAPADYDSDGDLDVAVLGFYVVYNQSVEYKLVLFRNDGEATPTEWEFSYIDVPLDDLTTGASDLAWGDVDNDGDEDLMLGTDGETVLYRNDAGTLVLTETVLPGYAEDNDQADFDLRSITWADFDNDGDLDAIIPSVCDFEEFEWRTAMVRNDGPDETGGFLFTEVEPGFAPTRHAQTQWADFDNDQDLDLLLVNLAPLTDDGFIRRYRNDGEGLFTGEDILGPLTVEHGEAQWGDYDEDGDYDILVAGHIKEVDGSFNVVLRIYRNDNETFVPFEVIDCIPCEGWFDITAATWADYDSDGDMDILMTGTYNSGSQIEGRAWIYINDGTGVFIESDNVLPAPRASGSRGGTFSWFDIDRYLDLDYFIAGEYFVPGGNGLIEAQMHVYRNDVGAENAAPTAPGGLTAQVNQASRSVVLSWNAASDDRTPVAALTYDLDLFRTAPSFGLVPHRLPEPGNVSSVLDWELTGLADGLYRWTLRAVDSAYNGGPIAQGTFRVGSAAGVEGAQIPLTFELATHPNPFHGSTSFRYALPSAAEVKLAVFDVHGRLVKQLVDETRAAGYHEISWEASNVASGTYFARLSAGDVTKTQRLLLVK